MKKIIIGSDHAGFPLKEAVKDILSNLGILVEDAGTNSPDISVDYPDFALKVARAVAKGEFDSGVVVCGTGLGASIAANKVPGIRAALCHDTFTAHQARAHNDANVLAMGAWVVSPQRAVGILEEWLKTPYEHGRHTPRVNKLNQALPLRSENMVPWKIAPGQFSYGVSMSLQKTVFGAVLFAGRLEEGLTAAAASEFELVELGVRDPQEINADALSAMVKKHGLRISALATGQSYLHDGLSLCSSEPEIRAKAVQRLQQVADLASQLGSAMIIGGVRGRFKQYPPSAEEYTLTTEAMRSCVHYAAERDVLVLLEPINRYETNLANTVADGIALIKEVDQPNFKLLVDLFHMNIEEVDIPSSLRQAGELIGYVHIADSNRRAPGQGHTDLQAALRTLVQIGYHGPLVAEMLPLPDDMSALHLLRNYLSALPETIM